jgi:hypothetical protein
MSTHALDMVADADFARDDCLAWREFCGFGGSVFDLILQFWGFFFFFLRAFERCGAVGVFVVG